MQAIRRSTYYHAAAGALMLGALGACGAGGPPELPRPRPLVVFSGERLEADSASLQEIHAWVTRVHETIDQDPSFLLSYETVPVAAYPWETYEFVAEGGPRGADTLRVGYEAAAPDVTTSYGTYAFLRLMHRRGELEEWFPEADGLEGYDLERFIMARTAESWLLGRTIFDTHPYPPMDELIYAADRGYLDEFLLTARGNEFPEAREAFEEENPGRLEEYRAWFSETFDRPPPGLRS